MAPRVRWSGTGRPVLFLPGWNTTAGAVRSWIPPDFQARFRCGVLEWPGLGEGAGDPLPDRVDDVLEDLARILPEDTRLVGFCLGGGAAWALARQHPGRVRQVVMVESSLYYPAVLAPLLLPGLGPALLRSVQSLRLGRALVGAAILQRTLEYPRAFREDLFAFDAAVAVHYLRLFRRYAKAMGAAQAPDPTGTPTDLVRLDGAAAVPVLAIPWGRRLQAPERRLRLEGAGHFPAVEAPQPFFQTLTALLEEKPV